MRLSTAAIVTVAALTAGACSAGDASSNATRSSETTAPPTTAPPTTAPPTTAPPTTVAPTTVAPTTVAPTTVAPTTGPIDSIDDLAATIERDLNLGEAILFEIGADPAAPDARSMAERFFVGRSLENVLEGTEDLVADDLILLPSPTTPNVIRLMSDPVLVESDEVTRATAVTCRIDASEVWARVNDGDVRVPIATGSIRIDSESRFVFVDGIWKLDGGQVIRRIEDATDCESAG